MFYEILNRFILLSITSVLCLGMAAAASPAAASPAGSSPFSWPSSSPPVPAPAASSSGFNSAFLDGVLEDGRNHVDEGTTLLDSMMNDEGGRKRCASEKWEDKAGV